MSTLLPSIDDVAARALGQDGYVESGGPTGHDGNIVHFWPDDDWNQYQGESWCAAFVTWLFLPWAGDGWIRYIECNQGMRIFRDEGKILSDPTGIKRGDVLFFHWPGDVPGANHTGIALDDADVHAGTVHTIEGNTGPDDSGSPSNGGGVYQRQRSFSVILGYGRPDYDPVAPPPPVVQFTVPGGVGFIDAPGTSGGWVYASDGGVFAVGDAQFYGSGGGLALAAPIVGAAATPTGKGYWLVAADGGVFSYGDATFRGSMGSHPLNKPIVGMARTLSGGGYWLVAADGGVFAFGDAAFYGSLGATPLNAPVMLIAATPSGAGYWMLARDGGVFAFGDAQAKGSLVGQPIDVPLVALVPTGSGQGYAVVGADGRVANFGDAAWKAYDPLRDEYAKGERVIVGADGTSGGSRLEMVSNKLEAYVL